MNNKIYQKNIYLIAIFSFLIILSGCRFEDLGLTSSNIAGIESKASEESVEVQLSEEELFLKMKAGQDKNPLSDINIRKAIFFAVDRERIVEELFGGYGETLKSLFAKDSSYWHPAWSEYEYDLEIAAEYLKRGGYGPDNPLYLTISAINNSDSKKIMEEILKEDFEKIGINLWIFNRTPKEFYQDHVYTGDYDLGIWSMYIFSTDELNNVFSSKKIPSMETEENRNCENFYWYANENVDSLLGNIEDLKSKEIIIEKTREIQDSIANDTVVLPLYSRLFVFAYNNNINNISLDAIKDRVFYNIESWTLPSDIELKEDEKSEIIIGYESDHIDVFNGFIPYSINDLIFRGLWKINNDCSYEPELIESFGGPENELIEFDGTDIAIQLKENIYWDDGTPVTSEDIKYTFEYFTEFMEEKEYFSRLDEDYRKIEEIIIIDEKNFRIKFDEIPKDWQNLFSMIFKKDLFKLRDIDYFPTAQIIGNGPYKIIEYDSNGKMVMELNEYYYGDLPEIERLIIRFDPDNNNLIAMLRDGEIDGMSIPMDPELMKTLEDNNFNLFIKPGNLMEHLALSLKPRDE